MTTPNWNTLSLDTSLALRTAATRLADDFAGIFGTETIERFLHTSYDQFADRATIAKFLPLIAERFARQRLYALANVEGLHHDGKPTVLFLCTHNAGRSQMALGFFPPWPATPPSAGPAAPSPADEINPAAIAAMAEVGIDISAEFPKPWTDETVRAADVVISMGCGDACPIFPGKRYEYWDDLDDPAGLDLDASDPSATKSRPESGTSSPDSRWPNPRSPTQTGRRCVAAGHAGDQHEQVAQRLRAAARSLPVGPSLTIEAARILAAAASSPLAWTATWSI